MTDPYQRIPELMKEVEREMRVLGLWSSRSPKPQALASTMPFCYDTLELSEWLQWIFLPRLRQLLDQDLPLPAKSGIAPLVEIWIKERGLEQGTGQLLRIIQEFDEVFSSAND